MYQINMLFAKLKFPFIIILMIIIIQKLTDKNGNVVLI